MSITFWNSGEKYTESIFMKVNNAIFFHCGKLSAKCTSVAKQICGKCISVKRNFKPLFLNRQIG